jgi:hypothetical protein
MAPATELFSSEALCASLHRRLARVDPGGSEPFAWSEADLNVAAQLSSWLATSKGIAVSLPATGIAVEGLPDLDWSAVTLEQLTGALVTAGRPDEPMSRTNLRIAIRRRLTDREATAAPGGPELSSEDARCLLELYAYLLQHDVPPLAAVPTAAAIEGHLDVDWTRISAQDLSRCVRGVTSAHPTAETATARGSGADAHDQRGEGGATVRDVEGTTDQEPTTYAAFAKLRAGRRSAQAQRLLAVRQDFRRKADAVREAHFQTAQELLADRTMPRSVRAQALRRHRQPLRRELDELALRRGEVLGGGRPWYDKLVERWRNERGDREDYARLLQALYDDRLAAARAGADRSSVGADPVLIAIAGVRRHRQGGALVYTQRTSAGNAELFRVCEDTREVVVRTKDAIATETAIVKAYQLAGPPLTFQGSIAFQARCEAIAARHGFAVTTHEACADVPGTHEPARAAASTSPDAAVSGVRADAPTAVNGPVVADLSRYGDIVAVLKEQTGIDYVVALEPKYAVPMEPVYLAHAPMHEGLFDLVFVQKPGVEAISAIVLPRGCVPSAAVGGETRLVLEIENGRWRAEFDVPPFAVERDHTRNDLGRSRGR